MKGAILALLFFTCILAHAGQFKYRRYLSAGSNPYQIIAASFTKSGNVDLAIADYPGNQIVILRGNGDGTFQKPSTFSVPAPIAFAVGDTNNDGNLDLVISEFGGTGESFVAIFTGDGTGKFHQASRYRSGVQTTGVALADFNGDGNLDVAVADEQAMIKVFPGTGKGTLGKSRTYRLPNSKPWAIAAGDLNGDGYVDLVVTEDGNGVVAVFMNDGTGEFKKPISYSAGGGEVLDVKIADLRNDGRNDLVTGNLSLSAVGVLLNNGDGTFGTVTLFHPHCTANAIVVADFNLDGKLDVACASLIDDSAFMYGRGDGTFGPPMPIKDAIGTDGGYSVASGDFNNDRAPDLAFPIWNDGKVAIMLNTQ